MKKILILLVIITIAITGVWANGQSEKSDGMKVGMTIQDLNNQVWASRAVALKKKIETNGGSFSYVGCDNNASKQISQIENFVAAGVDIIMVHPADDNAINSALKNVPDNIKVFVYDSDLENGDVRFLLDNYDAGKLIGKMAAEWINEKLGGKAEVAIINWPQLEILLERENGIRDSLAAIAPKAKVVAAAPALTPANAITAVETMLQAHPNIQIVCSIGGGGAAGANEAFKAAGMLDDKIGVFASDATTPELQAMVNGEACRFSIMYTGTSEDAAELIYGWLEKMYTGAPIDSRVYHVFVPVTPANAKDYM